MAVRSLVVPILVVVSLVAVATAIPQGFTSWFDSEQCPDGWYPLQVAEGRLIMSVERAVDSGITVGKPLQDVEDRNHNHKYSTVARFTQNSIAAIDCCNNQGACHDDYPVNDQFHEASTSLPFAQLLLCTNKVANADPVPFGTVAYFDPTVTQCPANWGPFSLSTGRFMLPGYFPKGLVPSTRSPMKPGDDIVHSHTFSASLKPIAVEYEGASGCCNNGPAHANPVNITGNSSVESTGIPYLSLLTCVSQFPSFDAKLPVQALLFNEVACPPGWNVSLTHSGRLLVALPVDGTPGATFGGASLRPGFSGDISHSHSFSGSVQTRPCGVGLASGCCAHGYAANNLYPYESVSATAVTALPYLSAPICVQTR